MTASIGFLAGMTMLFSIGRTVVSLEPLEPTESAFVLNGKLQVRSQAAAQLYRHGYARKILLAATSDRHFSHWFQLEMTSSEILVRMIQMQGVPASAIQVIASEGEVENTRDEIRTLRRHLDRHPMRELTVVTTDYHSGRTRLLLEQELAGLDVSVRVAGAPDDTGINVRNWWRSRDGIRIYGGEYLKSIGARLGL